MDYGKLNPCEYETLVRLLRWAETDCWCCTAIRGIVVGVWIGLWVAMLCIGAWSAALTLIVVGGPIVAVVLAAARMMWNEETPDDEA